MKPCGVGRTCRRADPHVGEKVPRFLKPRNSSAAAGSWYLRGLAETDPADRDAAFRLGAALGRLGAALGVDEGDE